MKLILVSMVILLGLALPTDGHGSHRHWHEVDPTSHHHQGQGRSGDSSVVNDGHGPSTCTSNVESLGGSSGRCHEEDSPLLARVQDHENDAFLQQALLGTLATCSASFLSSVVLYKLKPRAQPRFVLLVLSFACGCILAEVFLHILPHALTNPSTRVQTPRLFLAGVSVFFLLDTALDLLPPKENMPKTSAILNLLADALCNFTDGITIASTYRVSSSLGRATVVAVWLHEVPQEVGDFGVLVQAGLSFSTAITLNVLCSLVAVIGVGVAARFPAASLDRVLPICGGGLLYTSLSRVLDEIRGLVGHVRGERAKALHQSHPPCFDVVVLQVLGVLGGMTALHIATLWE
mmetsp:Transcript_6672/g.13565  ORF Transcript_6672/g.13565 Transcript_6672/m.13565 type:complete len:348 (-) Transcript_6672:1482-2525(-)